MNKARKTLLRFTLVLFLCIGAFGLTYAQPSPPGPPQPPGHGNNDGSNTPDDVPIDSPIAIGALLVLGSGLAVVLLYKKRKAEGSHGARG